MGLFLCFVLVLFLGILEINFADPTKKKEIKTKRRLTSNSIFVVTSLTCIRWSMLGLCSFYTFFTVQHFTFIHLLLFFIFYLTLLFLMSKYIYFFTLQETTSKYHLIDLHYQNCISYISTNRPLNWQFGIHQ